MKTIKDANNNCIATMHLRFIGEGPWSVSIGLDKFYSSKSKDKSLIKSFLNTYLRKNCPNREVENKVKICLKYVKNDPNNKWYTVKELEEISHINIESI